MWIVRLALRRPYTFVVVSLLIAVLGVLSIVSMPTDIFPAIDIPVISVIWNYGGLSPTEMQGRITTIVERALTTTVGTSITSSRSRSGRRGHQVFLQPTAGVNGALAQVTAACQTLLRPLPTGITPPQILQQRRRRAGPHGQPRQRSAVGAGNRRSRQQPSAHSSSLCAGAAVPLPCGGKSASSTSISIPMRSSRADSRRPTSTMPSTPRTSFGLPGPRRWGPSRRRRDQQQPGLLEQLNDIPVKRENGATVYLRDVAFVTTGSRPDQSREARRPAFSAPAGADEAVVHRRCRRGVRSVR